jgi:zinc protease
MVKKLQLKNGLKVLAVPSHNSPVVSVQMWVKTGSADESQRVRGISHFIEHLVFKGTQSYGLGQIAGTVESSGGELNAYTTFDQTVFYVTISKDYLNTGLDVVSQMMGFPLFKPEDIDNEREVVIEEIKRGNDDPHRQASRVLIETLYKKHPYGEPVIGYEDIIRKVTPKEIWKYYQSRYVPKNMTLVVAGDFEPKTFKGDIEKYFAGFKPYPLQKVKRAKESAPKKPQLVVKKTSFEENLLYLCWPGPQATHRDVPALDVLSLVFGQGESSRLNKSLRLDQTLVNWIGASTFTPMDSGFFAVSASVLIERLEDALNVISSQILNLRENPVTADEIDKARMNIQSEEAYSMETVDGLARKVGSYNLFFKDPEYQKIFTKQILAVEPADIKRMVEKYLNPKALSLVLLTPHDEKPLKEITQRWLKDFQKKWQKQKVRTFKKVKLHPGKNLFRYASSAKKLQQGLQKEVLKSGVVLLSRPNFETPVLSMRCGFLGGIRAEGVKREGLAELLSRTWVSATNQLSEQELHHRIESRASSLSAYSGRNSVGLSLNTLPRFTADMLELLSGVLHTPLFPAETIEREKMSMAEALRTRQDNLAQIAILNFLKILFVGHPYSSDPLGTKDSVSGFQVSHLKDFLKLHLSQKNCVVAMSGHIEPEHLDLVREIFGRLPAGSAFRDPFKFSPPTENRRHFQMAQKQQSHLVIGYSGLSITDPRRYALQVLQAILAGQGGRLFLELRDKASLAYSVSPLRMEGIDCGYFGAYIGCSPEKVTKALSMLREEFRKVTEAAVNDIELARAKKFLIGRHHIDLQRNSAICSSVLFDEIYGIPYDETFHFAERVGAVSAQDVLRVAQLIFSQKEIVSLVGPENP